MKKLLPIFLLVLSAGVSGAQPNEFYIESRLVNEDLLPVKDAYIVNLRSKEIAVSRANGVFGINVLPDDSIYISHVAYIPEKIHVFDLMMNPTIILTVDTVTLREVRIYGNPFSNYEIAAYKNIKSIQYSLIPPPTQGFTEKELVQDLINRENGIFRSQASSVDLKTIPLTLLKKIFRKKKEKKDKQQKNYPALPE